MERELGVTVVDEHHVLRHGDPINRLSRLCGVLDEDLIQSIRVRFFLIITAVRGSRILEEGAVAYAGSFTRRVGVIVNAQLHLLVVDVRQIEEVREENQVVAAVGLEEQLADNTPGLPFVFEGDTLVAGRDVVAGDVVMESESPVTLRVGKHNQDKDCGDGAAEQSSEE